MPAVTNQGCKSTITCTCKEEGFLVNNPHTHKSKVIKYFLLPFLLATRMVFFLQELNLAGLFIFFLCRCWPAFLSGEGGKSTVVLGIIHQVNFAEHISTSSKHMNIPNILIYSIPQCFLLSKFYNAWVLCLVLNSYHGNFRRLSPRVSHWFDMYVPHLSTVSIICIALDSLSSVIMLTAATFQC